MKADLTIIYECHQKIQKISEEVKRLRKLKEDIYNDY
jgi:hypothetical protein